MNTADVAARRTAPLVTLAVFAYNQENFIRDAVEAALAQTYQPLQIILSDDGSTDRTFEIMRELAGQYTGPHEVILNRNEPNVGVLAHVLKVVGLSRGELFVDSAGDDISAPNRVAACCEAWQRTGAWAITSLYDLIDSEGRVIARAQGAGSGDRMFWHLFPLPQPEYFVHGATAAYDRRVFEFLQPAEKKIFIEDAITSYVLWCLRKPLVRIEESLVRYRQHEGSQSNVGTSRGQSVSQLLTVERRKGRGRTAWLDVLEYLQQLPIVQNSVRGNELALIERLRRRLDAQSKWEALSVGRRLRILASCGDPVLVRWGAPRLFGLAAICGAKFLAQRMRPGSLR